MVKDKRQNVIGAACDRWINGDPLEAGRLIFEDLPTNERPGWASRILRFVLDRASVTNRIFEPILTAASDRSSWGTGHQVFSNLRAETLKLDDLRRNAGLSDEQERLAIILTIAELVAKVTYNATNPSDEFDEDSGWWIASCLKGLADRDRSDERFDLEAWLMLSSHK